MILSVPPKKNRKKGGRDNVKKDLYLSSQDVRFLMAAVTLDTDASSERGNFPCIFSMLPFTKYWLSAFNVFTSLLRLMARHPSFNESD